MEKYILQGNRTYKGKEIRINSEDPLYKESLVYNHMNGLISRSVDYDEPHRKQSGSIQYDAKGKVLTKVLRY
ncbi:MAG: hypothetical protein PHQ78_06020 [Candidatus Cloacimonetes bacterium]|nr:hypothetical protein [Candidatus Cloacimonadota bacterium]MDD4560671.1 hypothetical protein [Candidatus Cloacimonadota bacterium]